MENSLELNQIIQGCGYATISFLVLTIVAFIFKWGWRFRFVGVTSFMGVVTASIFALSLGLFTPVKIEGAIRYKLVYDNGANQAVITVPASINAQEIEATLRQAADDLFSPGRLGLGGDQLIIRMRSIFHVEKGLSQPLYLGEVKRSLANRQDENIDITIFNDNLKKLNS
jgi:hypothetical protein